MLIEITNAYFERLSKGNTPEFVKLAKEIAKYTNDQRKVTRILNSLSRIGVDSIEDLMKTDEESIARARNIGFDAKNIVRQIKGLPILTGKDEHPFARFYRVYFYKPEKANETWYKEFHTLRELAEYFNSDECVQTSINYIYEVKEDEDDNSSGFKKD